MGTVTRCAVALLVAALLGMGACPSALAQSPAPAQTAPAQTAPTAPAQTAPAAPAQTEAQTEAQIEAAQSTAPPAQADTAAPGTPVADAPEGQAQGTPLPPAPQGPPPLPAVACEPACAEGYACRDGGCVSSCYPPCGFGERCQQGGCTSSAAETTTDASGRPVPRWDWGAPPPDRRAAQAAMAAQPGFHEHDGFLLRASFAFGGGSVEYRRAGRARSLDGAMGQLSVDVGARVADNFALMGRLAIYGLGRDVQPSGDVGPDGSAETLGDTTSASFGGLFLGVAAAYYLMPINIYFGSALGLMGGALRDVDADGLPETKMQLSGGWVLQLEAVKEWWIGGDWGMGAGLRLSLGGATATESVPDDDAEARAIEDAGGPLQSKLSHFSIGLVGSTTFQ